MSDLKILYPKPVVVMLGMRQVSIRPVQLRHFEAFGQAAGGLISVIGAQNPSAVYAYAQSAPALRDLLGTCTSLSAWRIRRLPTAAALELMIKVVEINNGFFDQALVTAASRLAGVTSRKA
ncbi:MAG: hypothetical protein KJ989_15250 [Gammaproteobacteria bacterium]|uniref:Uncharacterized protein n=1 Tax=viral metagenome TaxID=1070528 RepID=A0A6M3J4F2_9ZZZZ|nr:hypothetical protein [Gammaproteobacteria bacterium]MBU2067474.1 hypothetical protein [Gammaproteobacteria bacterium]MBU2139484.1 hypothetical protein [Gammaproteobacteria bacterium]MBU2255911.1 hypothetical protein [Gammaproteobacteria bacterium]MBU2295556.1 hypothetical protein [Gammaproteobacteria bacterium]